MSNDAMSYDDRANAETKTGMAELDKTIKSIYDILADIANARFDLLRGFLYHRYSWYELSHHREPVGFLDYLDHELGVTQVVLIDRSTVKSVRDLAREAEVSGGILHHLAEVMHILVERPQFRDDDTIRLRIEDDCIYVQRVPLRQS